MGSRPKKISDSLATTAAQCTSIAQAEFNKIKGVPEEVNFGTLRDPRLEVGDTVELYDESLGTTGFYVLNKLSINMASGKMSGVIRRRM
jgi:hypothetical protein